MYYYYLLDDKVAFSKFKLNKFQEILPDHARTVQGNMFYLNQLTPGKSRKSFCISDPSMLDISKEDLNLLRTGKKEYSDIPEWILEKISSKDVMCINISYPDWQYLLNSTKKKSYKVNIVGLGDVGGILALGLKLQGNDIISSIGIYDVDKNKIQRWYLELNQIIHPNHEFLFPKVEVIGMDDLFNCDIFVFCVSTGVPKIGEEQNDVRLVQFNGNSKIINEYSKKARKEKFKGLFAVVSDPVDLLCKSAYLSSNTDEYGNYDYLGLAPEQIIGFGLGVMDARAAFYSQESNETSHYIKEGRVFGPHGDGLVVADSIIRYNHNISISLTEKVLNSNLKVRETGYKPYIAPAISSGALSIISCLKGEWHYSSTFVGGVFMGLKNRYTSTGIELEKLELPDNLFERLSATYKYLEKIL
ncbi:lactate/malate family dehydrogenase [Fervidicella metallireducens]|nr:lactate dehydrogenase [Fervidicella metallireducens]